MGIKDIKVKKSDSSSNDEYLTEVYLLETDTADNNEWAGELKASDIFQQTYYILIVLASREFRKHWNSTMLRGLKICFIFHMQF